MLLYLTDLDWIDFFSNGGLIGPMIVIWLVHSGGLIATWLAAVAPRWTNWVETQEVTVDEMAQLQAIDYKDSEDETAPDEDPDDISSSSSTSSMLYSLSSSLILSVWVL